MNINNIEETAVQSHVSCCCAKLCSSLLSEFVLLAICDPFGCNTLMHCVWCVDFVHSFDATEFGKLGDWVRGSLPWNKNTYLE